MVTAATTVVLFCWLAKGILGDDVEVQVAQGTLVGETVTTVTGENYASFKGIPYVKPPLGELRFQPPQDPESWEGKRNATAHGSVCPQVDLLTGDYIPGDEDCLFINVYSPNLKPDNLLDVLIYIHGGGYQYLSGNAAYFGPDYLVTKNIVVVTFNYRLSSLGFLSLGIKEAPGNVGLKDQVAALKWVQKNIKNFGGNPESVTIMGESAGGASVGFHMLSPMSKGLFHKAITQSGSPNCGWAMAYQPEKKAFKLGQTLGLNTKNKTELLTFLRSVPYDNLVNISYAATSTFYSEELTDIPFRMVPFLPIVETEGSDSFISKDPLSILDSGDVNKVDVLFSYNNRETLVVIPQLATTYIQRYEKYLEMFAPDHISLNSIPNTILETADEIKTHYFGNKTVTVENIVNLINLTSFTGVIYDVQRFYKRWTQFANVYFFKFASYASRNCYGVQGVEYNITGAAHFDEQCYIFDPKSLNYTTDINSIEYTITTRLTTAITNFAKYGDPNQNSSLVENWPKYENSTLAYINFGNNLTLDYAADEEEYSFWKNIYEKIGLPF